MKPANALLLTLVLAASCTITTDGGNDHWFGGHAAFEFDGKPYTINEIPFWSNQNPDSMTPQYAIRTWFKPNGSDYNVWIQINRTRSVHSLHDDFHFSDTTLASIQMWPDLTGLRYQSDSGSIELFSQTSDSLTGTFGARLKATDSTVHYLIGTFTAGQPRLP